MTLANMVLEHQDIQAGWAVFHLSRLEVEVKLSENFNSRTLRGHLDTPDHAPIQVAIPFHAGAGTQPENTITLQTLADQGQQAIQTLEHAIRDAVKITSDDKGAW